MKNNEQCAQPNRATPLQQRTSAPALTMLSWRRVRAIAWFVPLVVSLVTCELHAAERFPPSARIVTSASGRYPHVLVPPTDTSNVPSSQRGTGYPLVVSLHGSSLRGNRLSNLTKYGSIAAINAGMTLPAYVLAPQCPSGQRWDPHKLHSTIQSIIRDNPIDTNRIYVIGMSMGGYGTFDLVGTYPERFAAAIAMCGGGQVAMADNLSRVPLWVIHGAADRAVPPSQSRRIVDAICSTDSNICYFTVIPGLGHGALSESYGHQKLYTWLFQFSKDRAVDRRTTAPPAYAGKDFTWGVVDKKKYRKRSTKRKYKNDSKRKRRGRPSAHRRR